MVDFFFSSAVMEGERKSPGDAEIERLSSSDDYWAWRDEALGLLQLFWEEEEDIDILAILLVPFFGDGEFT